MFCSLGIQQSETRESVFPHDCCKVLWLVQTEDSTDCFIVERPPHGTIELPARSRGRVGIETPCQLECYRCMIETTAERSVVALGIVG
jgi:hypothetical protein